MSGIPKAIAKRNMLFTGFTARLIIFFVTLGLSGGLRPDQVQEILFIQSPASAFYITLLVVYIIRHAYRQQRSVKKVSRFYIWSGYIALILITMAEATLIYLKALFSDNIPGDWLFCNCLLVTEALFAVFTAIYPSNLLVVAVVDGHQTPT
jgi:hypothetical protein